MVQNFRRRFDNFSNSETVRVEHQEYAPSNAGIAAQDQDQEHDSSNESESESETETESSNEPSENDSLPPPDQISSHEEASSVDVSMSGTDEADKGGDEGVDEEEDDESLACDVDADDMAPLYRVKSHSNDWTPS